MIKRACVKITYHNTKLKAYYKKQFNENSPLKIKFRNQPGVDTGGVLRQFYTVVFEQMLIGTDDMPPLFEGKQGRKVPIYNAGVIISNVMSHWKNDVSLDCSSWYFYRGPAYFSASIFHYFVFGDFNPGKTYSEVVLSFGHTLLSMKIYHSLFGDFGKFNNLASLKNTFVSNK